MIRGKVPEIQDIKIKDTVDFGDTTLDTYLKELLKAIWLEGEGFSGKRPFGNSGWQWDINSALVQKYPTLGKMKDGSLWNVNEKLDLAVVARIEKIFHDAKEFERLQKITNIDSITVEEV